MYGNWLLVRPEEKDSVWVIDVGTGKHIGTAAARWTDDLPAVAPPHTLLVRRGTDLVGLDLSVPELSEIGRIRAALQTSGSRLRGSRLRRRRSPWKPILRRSLLQIQDRRGPVSTSR